MHHPVRRNGRRLASLGLGLFLLSTAFPLWAGLDPAPLQRDWRGVVDVGLALVLCLTAMLIHHRWGRAVPAQVLGASYRVCRLLAVVPLALLALFLFAPVRVHWEVLLVGLAWRTWLLVETLPAMVAAWRGEAG